MTFRVRIDPVAQRLIDEFAIYLRDYSEEFAIEQFDRLDRILSINLQESPLTWTYFAFTGAPYRAYLFRVGRRTQYWDHLHRRRGHADGQYSSFLERQPRSEHAGFVIEVARPGAG
jgi:hypothetical protein